MRQWGIADQIIKRAQPFVCMCIRDSPIRERAMQGLYEMMMDYIEEHLKENLDLNELSRIFHVSKYHISHVFKDETGISFKCSSI